MRTQVPKTISTDLLAAIQDVESAHMAVEAGVPGDPHRKLVTEYLFVATAALLEGFISDLFVAYINRTSDTFRKHLLKQITFSSSDDFAKRALQHVGNEMPHLNVDQIRHILDPRGYNLTFDTTAEMKTHAGLWLSPADAVRFTGCSKQQCAFIDSVKAVRNFLAHRSQSADDKMQEALNAADLPTDQKRGAKKVLDVGAHLRAISHGQSRFRRSLAHVRRLATQLCP